MSVRRTHNRSKERPYGRDFLDVLRRSKAFNTTTVCSGSENTIYHDDFEIHPFKSKNGGVIWFCERITLNPFKKPDGTRTFRWNGKKWEEVQEV